ncbi:hypothetical protein ACJZ2D_009563 [Fusarium nematophilum]
MTESECMAGEREGETRIKITKGIVFEKISAYIEGNYKSIMLSAKKKYEGMNWDGSLDTKGLAVVKRYTLSRVMAMLSGDLAGREKTEKLVMHVGS